MVDVGALCVATLLPTVVGGDLARRALQARSVRRDVDDYLGWVEADIRHAAEAGSVPTGRRTVSA
jgi:hypothetical protein